MLNKVTLPRDDHGTLDQKAHQPVSNFTVFINQTDVSVLPPDAARHQKLIVRCSKHSKKVQKSQSTSVFLINSPHEWCLFSYIISKKQILLISALLLRCFPFLEHCAPPLLYCVSPLPKSNGCNFAFNELQINFTLKKIWSGKIDAQSGSKLGKWAKIDSTSYRRWRSILTAEEVYKQKCRKTSGCTVGHFEPNIGAKNNGNLRFLTNLIFMIGKSI